MNSGQNACLAPSSERSLLREFKRSQTSFSGHKCIKNVWRPGSARTRWESLSAPPDPLAVGVAASRPGWPLRGQGGDPQAKLAPLLWKFLDPPVLAYIAHAKIENGNNVLIIGFLNFYLNLSISVFTIGLIFSFSIQMVHRRNNSLS